MKRISGSSASTRTTALTPGPSALSGLSERLAGLVLLAAASPVIAVSAAILAVTYRRSPFIAHWRMGRNSVPFWMLKLRTMQPEPGASDRLLRIETIVSEPASSSKPLNDPRVANRFAAFCRRHSIDELPQLWHVVNGTMSLVGPRPLTRGELDRYYGRAAKTVLSVKPGLTGLWQVQGRSYLSMPERVALDLELVRRTSLWKKLWILWRTARAIVTGYGAW